jgi:hypothetical protein
MASKQINTANIAITSEEVRKLRMTVADMDSLAHHGLSKIRAIAKLALNSLETPEGYLSMDEIAHTLEAIWFLSENTADCIYCQAEDAGISHKGDADHRRREAARAARQLGDAV